MNVYRVFPSTNGPSSPILYNGNFIAGLAFCVTGEAWFQGYWWWVCGSGQSTSPVKCALWQQPPSISYPTLVPGSVVTSGELVAGQWNWIPLAKPLALSLGGSPGMTPPINGGDTSFGLAVYVAAIGVNGNFPDTSDSFGSGDLYAAGITNGPLTAYSDTNGTMAPPQAYYSRNGMFSTAGSDPSVDFPDQGTDTSDNFWVDVQVGDYGGVPAGTSLRLFPNVPAGCLSQPDADNTEAVSATAFTLSQPCTLDRIWMYSPTGTGGLPTRAAIWDTDTQAEVTGTDNSSPAWLIPGGGSASPGDGWIYVDYTDAGVTLPAGNYATSFYNGDGVIIYGEAHNYFFAGTDPVSDVTVGGPGWNGVSCGGGILTAPNVANGPKVVYDNGSGTFSGNGIYRPAGSGWGYPTNFESSSDWGECRMADVEVTPVAAASSGLLLASFP